MALAKKHHTYRDKKNELKIIWFLLFLDMETVVVFAGGRGVRGSDFSYANE